MEQIIFTVIILIANSWASPLIEWEDGHSRSAITALQATVITSPLTSWVKNNNTNLQWYMNISIGSPPQNFSVLIDTGSSSLLIPQSNCTSCSPNQRKFDPSRSSTFSYSPSSKGNRLEFGTGGDTIPLAQTEGAACSWAIDHITLPTSPRGVTLPSYEFLLCYQEDEALTLQPGIDGILGLGLNGSDPIALQWALYNAGLLGSGSEGGVYGLYLPPGRVSGGELTLGGIDKTKFQGNMTWISLDRDLAAAHSQWVMDLQTIYINGKQLQIPERDGSNDTSHSNHTIRSNGDNGSDNSGRRMVPYPRSIAQVLDSGTPSIMAPSRDVAAAVYAQISPDIYQIDKVGTWGASCEDMANIVATGAEITFTLGWESNGMGTQLNVTIPSSVFNLGPYPNIPGVCQAVVNNWQDPVVYNNTMGLWVLGSPLLKNYYTAWDGLNQRVGFALLKDPAVPTTIPNDQNC